jgi:hypothetical protein
MVNKLPPGVRMGCGGVRGTCRALCLLVLQEGSGRMTPTATGYTVCI